MRVRHGYTCSERLRERLTEESSSLSDISDFSCKFRVVRCSGLLVAKSQAVGSKKVESGRLPWGVLGDDVCASHAASAQKENLASQRGGLRLDREAIS